MPSARQKLVLKVSFEVIDASQEGDSNPTPQLIVLNGRPEDRAGSLLFRAQAMAAGFRNNGYEVTEPKEVAQSDVPKVE